MDSININTQISNIALKKPFYNASGIWASTKEQLSLISLSNSAAVLTKTVTLNKKPEPKNTPYVLANINNSFSLNAVNLYNPGLEYYTDINYSDKPYFMSIDLENEFTAKQIFNILKNNNNIDLLEINVSCPNVDKKYSLESTLRILKENPLNIPFGLKLPPYLYDLPFDILNEYKPSFIVSSNTIPNCLYVDIETESPLMKNNNGFGGLGGFKYISLSNVNKFYNELNRNIDIIGCGGVSTGHDVFEYILCGAKAVQVGTAIINNRGRENVIFNNLEITLKEIMKEKGYNKISDFLGKIMF